MLTIGLLCPSGSMHAQQLQASLSHYSTDNGLSSNTVSHITQDDLGYIWISTWNGFSRFDGFHFVNYQTGPQSGIPLLHNRVIDISVDMQQNVWLRMYDGRIFVLDRHTDKIVNPFEQVARFQDFKTSIPLTVTTKGEVIIVIDDIGIYRLRMTDKGITSRLVTTGRLKISAIVEGYGGDLWVATDKGIRRLNADDETLTKQGVFDDEHITCAFSNGYNVYAGTLSGKIVTFAYGQEPKVVATLDKSISSVFVDSHQLLWFTIDKQGISRLNLETGDIKDFSQWVPVPEYDIHGARITEVAGTLWASMNHGGFGYYNRERDEMEYFHNDPADPWNLSNTTAAYLVMPEGVVWESTSKRGLEKLIILKSTITRPHLFEHADEFQNGTLINGQIATDNDIRALYYDKKRNLLLIGNKKNNLVIIHPDRSRQIITTDNSGTPLGRIYGINMDSKGNYWIAAKGNGLLRMSHNADGGFDFLHFTNNSKDPLSLNNNNVYSTIEDKDGNIWVATYGGGVNILTRKENGKYIFLNCDNALRRYPHKAHQKVRSLILDNEGFVWAGTTDGILRMKYADKHITIERLSEHISPSHPISSNDIVCLAMSPKGVIWIGTNGGGLCRCLGRDEDGKWMFENYNSKDGLPSEEIKSITFDLHGDIWFSTDHILCSYNDQKRVFSSYSIQDGVDNTICSECAAITLPNGNMLFGTIDGYYKVNKTKLAEANTSAMKLRITDFFYNEELMSPRTSELFAEYIPESKSVTMPDTKASFAFRFASLNYPLQQRIHYQYLLEGYDKEWNSADKDRTAHYTDVPSGKYKFKVRAFLLEAPDKFEERVIEVIIPNPFLLSSDAVWLYMAIVALTAIGSIYYRQKWLSRRNAPES